MKTLNSYLIDYHRPTGKVTCTHYSSPTEATRERIRRTGRTLTRIGKFWSFAPRVKRPYVGRIPDTSCAKTYTKRKGPHA